MRALPINETSFFQLGASPVYGTSVGVPPMVPTAVPDPVGVGRVVLIGRNGKPGVGLGVSVEEPSTISGISAEAGAADIVEEPERVAVNVVSTSVKVVVLNGALTVGFVVGARVVTAANAPPE